MILHNPLPSATARPTLISPRLRFGIAGLFWQMPDSWQRDRIRLLARTLNPETVSTLTRRSKRETVAILTEART